MVWMTPPVAGTLDVTAVAVTAGEAGEANEAGAATDGLCASPRPTAAAATPAARVNAAFLIPASASAQGEGKVS